MPRPGRSEAEIDKGIASFAGLPHRLQPAGQINNILFVNDSKAIMARQQPVRWPVLRISTGVPADH